MRTNIVLDDKLIREAFRYVQVSTKRELVDLALRELIKNHRRRDVRELRGKVKIRQNYDYKALRTGVGKVEEIKEAVIAYKKKKK